MNSLLLLAQVGGGGSVVQWAIYIVLFAAVVALVLLGLRTMGVAVPPFVVQAGWIVVIAVVIIVAIIFLSRLAGQI